MGHSCEEITSEYSERMCSWIIGRDRAHASSEVNMDAQLVKLQDELEVVKAPIQKESVIQGRGGGEPLVKHISDEQACVAGNIRVYHGRSYVGHQHRESL